MKKGNVFIDCDGTKFDTLIPHVVYINQRYGIESAPIDYRTNPRIDSVIKKYLPADLHHTINYNDVYEDINDNFLNADIWNERISPIEDMVEVVPELSRKYRLWTVTARQISNSDMTWKLINKYIPGCIRSIHFVYSKNPHGGFTEIPKIDFILNCPGERVAFIDDSVFEIGVMQDILPSYLFDQYGFNDSAKHIANRVRGWREIGEMLL